jgi:hypothetical protein
MRLGVEVAEGPGRLGLSVEGWGELVEAYRLLWWGWRWRVAAPEWQARRTHRQRGVGGGLSTQGAYTATSVDLYVNLMYVGFANTRSRFLDLPMEEKADRYALGDACQADA